jgi:plastocyanin domain-containing protein
VVLLVLGLLSIDTGLNLMGSPVSITRLLQTRNSQVAEVLDTDSSSAPTADGEINLKVVNSGYEPNTLHAPANTPLTLNLITRNTQSCSRAFLIPELKVDMILPATGVETVKIAAQPSGKVIDFTCSMGMYTGQIIFDL